MPFPSVAKRRSEARKSGRPTAKRATPGELEDHLPGRPADGGGNRVPPGDPDRHENGGRKRKDRDREEMT